MNLLNRLPIIGPAITNLQNALREGETAKAMLDRMYSQTNVGVVPGRYYMILDHGSGGVKGYLSVCSCGISNQVLSLLELFAQNLACKCGREVSLLKHIKAVDASGKVLKTTQEIYTLLAALPVRPVLNQSTTRYLDTGVPDAPDDIKQERQRLMWI